MFKFRDLRADEIDVRVQSIKQKDGKATGAILLLYKDARCDMKILDEAVGVENWQREHYECKGNLFCRVGLNANYDKPDVPERWVWKSDCGVESNTEAQKGEASDSFKRACFNFGIGRELYTAPFIYLDSTRFKAYDTFRKDKAGNPVFATNDKFSVEEIEIVDKRITKLVIYNDTQKGKVFIYKAEEKQ